MTELQQPTDAALLNNLRELVVLYPDGEYFIHDVSIMDIPTSVLRTYIHLLNELPVLFPQYRWKSTESLDLTQRGILISWRKK